MAGNTTFKQVGNLAFYDGWSPNYVYFNSLLSYAHATSEKTGRGGWDPKAAGDIAMHAAMDAIKNSNLNQMSNDDSIIYFTNKFNSIIDFLKTAVESETASENAYLKQLLRDLKKTFTPEERKKITAIQRLENIITDGITGEKIEYDKINTLINVLFMGFKNTRTLIDYEQKRVEELDTTLHEIIKSRGSQAAGLGKAMHKDLLERVQMSEKAEDKLKRAITVEYVKTGQLTRKDSDGKFVLWGGATLEKKIPKAIDRVFAQWIENMIEKVINDKKFVEKIRRRLSQNNYPVDGNFSWLEEDVQEQVIQAIIAYGLGDLSTMLSNTISDELVEDVKKRMFTRNNNNNLLDTVQKYNINGLDAQFGRTVKETKLFKDAHSLADIKENEAEKLFAAIRVLVKEEKDYMKKNKKHSASKLIQAMENSTTVTGEDAFSRTEHIIDLIASLEGLEKDMEKAKKDWLKKVKETDDTLTEITKEVKLSKKAKSTITITVVNGQVEVDQSSLLTALQEDNRLSSFNLKKFNPQTLKTTLGTLKSRASKILKQDIIDSLKKAKFKIPESQLVGLVKRELTSVKIHINGPTLAELLTGIYFTGSSEKAIVDWNKYAGKNDSVEILIQHNKSWHKLLNTADFLDTLEAQERRQFDILQKKVEQAQHNLALEYQKNIDSQVKSLTQSNDMQKYSKMKEVMSTDIKQNEEKETELQKAYKELEELTTQLTAELRSLAKSHGEVKLNDELLVKAGEEYLNTLQNAFYVSTTVKSANDYVNELGFKGGTLGSTLDAQLARLSDIFESAGTPIDENDLLWLRSAIINCFPGSVVGEKNKSLIESYLGSLAAFALFDEGAVEANIIDNFKVNITKAIRENNARKIVHLYVVDSLYVKGSTVLQRTLDSLQGDVMKNIAEIPSLMRKGAGVIIINNASESSIPNRPWKEYKNGGADENAWAATGAAVAESVSVNILFLAGLLDIIHSINNTLSKVNV